MFTHVKLAQAAGGAVAVIVGVYMMNAVGPRSASGTASFETISVQNSRVSIVRSRFTNCSVISVTESSLGSANVHGGAFCILFVMRLQGFVLGMQTWTSSLFIKPNVWQNIYAHT